MAIMKMKIHILLLVLKTAFCAAKSYYFRNHMSLHLKNDRVWNDTIQAVEYDLFEACGDEYRTMRLRFGDYIFNNKMRFVYDDFYKNMRESSA